MATSAASRSGPDAAGTGPRSPSQPISARGSADSIRVAPSKATPPGAVASRPLNATWVRPGTRNAKFSMFQPSPSDRRSPPTRCSIAPASVTVSTLIPRRTATGRRCARVNDSAKVLMAVSGRRCAASGSARIRSRSICDADRVATSSGLGPNDSLASPLSLTARSSGPYWNSTWSSTAAVPLMRA